MSDEPRLELPDHIAASGPDNVLVRRASQSDLPDLMQLLAQMHEEDPDQPSQAASAAFTEILAMPSRALLVAERDSRLLGTLDLIVVPNLTRGGRPWAIVENMVVDKFHRRQGIGGALLDAAVEIAESVNCYKLQLVSHARRDAAHGLYEHAGFEAPVRGFRRYL